MNDTFQAWLSKELTRRGWSHNELGRRGGISQTAVSNVISGNRKAGADFCVKVAQALELSPVLLLVKAGILPPQEPANDENLQELIDLARNLPPEDRKEILEYVRFRYHRRKG